ncbi:FG-GAP repeat domain-containing protein [Streptomyces sp. NPDC058486]|uniref:FG-GAP repeat domain-containing protein n=1 Tax=unclassified Streptomyces TaxID=2593676 RepID=UPI00365C0A12
MKFARRRAGFRGALVATATAVAVAAATGAGSAAAAPAPVPERVVAPAFNLYGVHQQTQELWEWYRDGPYLLTDGPDGLDHADLADRITVDNTNNGSGDGTWTLYKNGRLDFSGWVGGQWRPAKNVGRGWNTYTTVLSTGTLGGAKEADLIGVDTAGVLWIHLGYADGRLAPRTRVGGGWGPYTQIAGQGDLTGDGRADIVARDKTGVLWLYKGTGDYKTPFAGRERIGGGWNAYDRLLSVGDIDADGKVDLLARKTTGELLRYSGTGDAARPFKAPVQIKGTGMKDFNLL